MIPREVKKQMERELRQYYENKNILEKIKKNNSESTRRLLYLETRILYVENVLKRLNPFEKEVFHLIYKDGADCVYCQTIKNISKSTYYNIINKCIRFLAEEWGII